MNVLERLKFLLGRDDSPISDEDAEVIRAVRQSDAHPDMAMYALKAAEAGGTGVLNSLKLFHDNSGVSRMAEIGTPGEKALWNHGAAHALDVKGNWDTTNRPILEDIAGVEA